MRRTIPTRAVPLLAFPALLLSMLLLPGRPASAQIVNVQPLFEKEEQEGFTVIAGGSADWRTGNNELTLLSGNLTTRYKSGAHQFFLLARGELGDKPNAPRFLNRDLEHLRWRIAPGGRGQFEVFVQHDRDEFRRLALRAIAGAGPRFSVLAGPVRSLAIGVAYMVEYERLREDAEADAGQARLNNRISSYAVAGWKLSETVRVAETVYLQPRIDDPEDVRALSESELRVGLTSHLSLGVSLVVAYDARAPEGLEPLDTALKNTLQLSF